MNLINRPLVTMISVATLLVGCDSLGIKKTDNAKAPVEIPIETPVAQAPIPTAEPQEQKFETVWERIRTGYGLPETSNSAVDAQVNFYTKNRTYFYKVTQQSEPFIHYVVSEMQANGMPLELALLPFIESSYNPVAASANNMGMWQFGAATGRNFGLKQNRWYDGRKDVVASTDAAIRLLKKLYARFDNDWLLAVAAYNAGDGSIQQAIDKNRRAGKPTDFWSLPLNKTTRGYIPQLLALSKIVAKPEAYDFKLYPIADVPYFVKVNVDSQINLADAAKSSSLDSALLKKLNAGFHSWLTDPSEPRDVLVPVEAAANFRLQLDSLPKIPVQTIVNNPGEPNTYHTVKSGENLWSIARAENTSVNTLIKLNNLDPKSALKPGQKLILAGQSVAQEVKEVKTQKKASYTIKAGDTLGQIAAKHDISVKQIMEWNKIKDETSIRPNQELIVMAEPTNQ
ncbi:MAG: LysM peptidoglycan-binding domain-containing protein [Gammaproteobacteria bacterium]|nr:MAG: LysM peptidoglycan-binding domain-containing protein [Gammaproteobacteria bacterium]